MNTSRRLVLATLMLGCAVAAPAADPRCAPAAPPAHAAQGKEAALVAQLSSGACQAAGLSPAAQGNPSVADVLKLALAPRKPRGDRLKPPNPRGMPAGSVMPIDGQIAFDAREAAAETLLGLELTGRQLSLRVAPFPPGGVAVVPASRLVPGEEYRWVLRTGKWTYDGTFQLPDAATMQRVAARVSALSALRVDRITLMALEAAIYDDEEIHASRDQVVERLRTELGQ